MGGREVRVLTDRGVFSASALDKGTEVLLKSVPAPTAGSNVLDLGCGWGAVALDLALKNPSCTVWAADVNERALGLCRENAEKLGLKNVEVLEEGEEPPALDFIYSNPPVRIGKEEMHKLLASWIERLKEGGRAYLVVSRHLGSDSLMDWMKEEGWKVKKIKSSKGYRVIEVCR